MTARGQVTRAYRQAASYRGPREQEADVFRHVNFGLRRAMTGGRIERCRALADNRRLWLTVADLMADPANALPAETRAGLISLSLSVRREMEQETPDISFLIGINETIISGLTGAG